VIIPTLKSHAMGVLMTAVRAEVPGLIHRSSVNERGPQKLPFLYATPPYNGPVNTWLRYIINSFILHSFPYGAFGSLLPDKRRSLLDLRIE